MTAVQAIQEPGRAQSAPVQRHVPQSLLGLSNVRRPPRWSFRGRHASGQNASGPGPGAYFLQSPDSTSRYQKSPKFGFSVSSRDMFDKHNAPGPGAYDEKRGIGTGGSEAPSYSMTPRHKDKAADKAWVPGPGSHETATRLGQGPKFTATPRRDAQGRPSPGPGEYNQADEATSEKTPRWGFGTASRPHSASNVHGRTPGPGTYGAASGIGEAPRYTMQPRRVGQRPQPSPGPGAHGGMFTTFK